MSLKKVLMLGWEYPPHHVGGLGVACKGMAHALIDNNVHVCFMLPRTVPINDSKVRLSFADSSMQFPQTSTRLEVLVRELYNPYISSKEYETRLQEFIKAGGKIMPRSLFEQVELYKMMVKARSKKEFDDFDVIHAHDWLCFPAGIAIKEKTGKPLVVHVHATEFDRSGGTGVNQLVYDKEREGMHIADKIIAVSEFTKNIIVNHYGIDKDKVIVVHNGNTSIEDTESKRLLPLMRFKHDGKKVILYAGRITIQKGVDYFIKAARKVLDYENNVHFIIAGTGDMEHQVKELVCNLGMATDFTFTGSYTVDEQKTLYKLADLVVMPSVSEPFGIIPLESMTTGTPVIVSKQSGVSEVITHGLKVDFWDTDEIANKMIAVIRHPSLQETLQKEGFSQASGITWDKAAKKLKTIYQTIT